jgi:acyl-CoA thioesterase
VQEDPQAVAERSAARMYEADLASRDLGIQIEQVAPGQATARMLVRDTMLNGHNICHGGYVFLLADTAFAFACNTYGPTTVAAACNIAFLAPAHLNDELIATATERHHAGRNGNYDVTVRLPNEAVIAEFRGHSRALRQ